MPQRLLTAAFALAATLAVTTSPVSAKAKPCTVRGGKLVAHHGGVRLFTKLRTGDDDYGPRLKLLACAGSHPAAEIDDAGGIVPGSLRVDDHFVAYAFSYEDPTCTKYMTGDDCHVEGVRSASVRTGDTRVGARDVAAEGLALAPSGALAWTSPARADGTRSVYALDVGAPRELDAGAIDAGSLRVEGRVVSWTRAGLFLAEDLAVPASFRGKACSVRHGRLVKRSGTVAIYSRVTEEDDLYGDTSAIYACVGSSAPVRLDAELAEGAEPSLVAIGSRYVGFAVAGVSSSCTKQLDPTVNCSFSYLASYDLRTGARRVEGAGSARALVVDDLGYLAWVTAPDASGQSSVIAADDRAVHPVFRTLATGTIDPASLKASGLTVSWTAVGVPASARVG